MTQNPTPEPWRTPRTLDEAGALFLPGLPVVHLNPTLGWSGVVALSPDGDRVCVRLNQYGEILVCVVWDDSCDFEGLRTGWMVADAIGPADPTSAGHPMAPTGNPVINSDFTPPVRKDQP